MPLLIQFFYKIKMILLLSRKKNLKLTPQWYAFEKRKCARIKHDSLDKRKLSPISQNTDIFIYFVFSIFLLVSAGKCN